MQFAKPLIRPICFSTSCNNSNPPSFEVFSIVNFTSTFFLPKPDKLKSTGCVEFETLALVDQRNSKRLYKLINQLLELPKIDSGTLKLLVSRGDIIAYSQDILDLFKGYAHSKNIQIKFSSKEKNLHVYFDRDNIETSHIPVFLLTAKSEQEDQLTGLDMGADDYITKPFNVDSLKLRISNTIAARKILLDKFSNDLNPIPEGIQISSLDHNLLKKIIEFVKKYIDTDITGDILAEELGLSKSNLYKKLKDLTGISVNIYIRNIRLNVAAQLLKKDNYNISEVAYAVGFNNPKYFSPCFMKYYGKSPRSFMTE